MGKAPIFFTGGLEPTETGLSRDTLPGYTEDGQTAQTMDSLNSVKNTEAWYISILMVQYIIKYKT